VKLGMQHAFWVDRDGLSGGLGLLWKDCVVSVTSYSIGHIDAMVEEEGEPRKWRITGIDGILGCLFVFVFLCFCGQELKMEFASWKCMGDDLLVGIGGRSGGLFLGALSEVSPANQGCPLFWYDPDGNRAMFLISAVLGGSWRWVWFLQVSQVKLLASAPWV
ncbi:hypothetical protein U1Q18_022862, partial [Sarracenia purpurea var. burkii]